MADDILSSAAEFEAEFEMAARTLARDPAAKALATQILREELRTATAAERGKIIAAITLLERAPLASH